MKQNARRKESLQVLENIGSGYHQTYGDERKKFKKEYLSRTRKLLETKLQQLEDRIKKPQRKTDYSHQKQYRQHKHQQIKNNKKTKMRKKQTNVWTFQATNQRNLTRENVDMTKIRKP